MELHYINSSKWLAGICSLSWLILIAFPNIRPLTDGAGKVTMLVSVKGATKFGKKLDDLHPRPISFANFGLVGAYWKEADL